MKEIDPAVPEQRPDIYVLGRCGACVKCFVDRRTGRCSCGGPFNERLEGDFRSFVAFPTK